jgi:hypothetical protein
VRYFTSAFVSIFGNQDPSSVLHFSSFHENSENFTDMILAVLANLESGMQQRQLSSGELVRQIRMKFQQILEARGKILTKWGYMKSTLLIFFLIIFAKEI